MVYKLPTAKETFDQILSQITSSLNAVVPSSPKSFTKIWSVINSTVVTSLYKYANDQFKDLLIITATRNGLLVIGEDYGIPIKPATNAILTVSIAAYNGAIIDTDKEFIGDLNGLSYYPQYTAESTGATVTFDIISQETDTDNNMEVTDTLTLASPIAGVGQTATVTAIVESAIDEEDIEVYRQRLLYARRNRGGGGNAADYKKWSEEPQGVKRAYPITGLPYVDESVEDFTDGDCELVGTAEWTSLTIDILTKDVINPFEGTRDLKIDPDGVGGGVYQDCLVAGQGYTIKGYVRLETLEGGADDVLHIITYKSSGSESVTVGSHTLASTYWTYFETTFIATYAGLGFWRLSDSNFHLDYMTLEPSIPLQRTVFVEAVTDIDSDGIAPQYLLDDVRTAINNDPITGFSRPPMGHADALLYVRSIYRTEIFVKMTSLVIEAALEAACKAQIATDLDTYLRSVFFYNAAIDSDAERIDIISDASLGNIVYAILLNYGASVTSVSFGLTAGVASPLSRYFVKAGELTKLGAAEYD